MTNIYIATNIYIYISVSDIKGADIFEDDLNDLKQIFFYAVSLVRLKIPPEPINTSESFIKCREQLFKSKLHDSDRNVEQFEGERLKRRTLDTKLHSCSIQSDFASTFHCTISL